MGHSPHKLHQGLGICPLPQDHPDSCRDVLPSLDSDKPSLSDLCWHFETHQEFYKNHA